MSGPDREAIDAALARFLDGESEPDDGALLVEAMRADERFAREVAHLLRVDDLLRQATIPDDRTFLEALLVRLATEREGGGFTAGFERRVRRRRTLLPMLRQWLPWTIAAAALVVIGLDVWLRLRGPQGVPPAARPSPPLAQATSLDNVAMVFKLEDVRWEPGDELPATEGTVLKPRRCASVRAAPPWPSSTGWCSPWRGRRTST